MDTVSSQPTSSIVISRRSSKVVFGLTLLLIIAGALVVYKGTTSLAVIAKVQNTRAFQPRTNVVPVPGNEARINVVERSINYFLVVWPALLFGVLISGAVRVLDPPRWLDRAMGRGRIRPQIVSGLAGAPLMLCSCCVAPVFSGMYERSSRFGPSLALMLAAPSLNPAALLLTFMLFDSKIALTRLVIAAVAVFFTGILIERLFTIRPIECAPSAGDSTGELITGFMRSSLQVAVRTIPLIAIGVVISMAIALWLPVGAASSPTGQIITIIVVALFAVALALPTFFEIPLALILLSAGAPTGAAVAMLIAGPAINLPSLFAIARSTSWTIASAVAFSIFALAVGGGLLVTIF